MPGRWRGRGALGVEPLGEPSNEVGRAVLIGRARTHWASHQRGWASQYSLGEPSTRLGEPVLIGRAINEVGRAYSLGEPVLGKPSNEVGASHQTRLGEPVLRGRWASHSTFTAASTPASKLRLLGAVPRVLLGTSSACLARLVKCLLGTVPARHV